MTITLDLRSRHSLTRNETIVFQANPLKSKVQVPRKLMWHEACNLEEINIPKPIHNNSNASRIVELSDGTVMV